MEVHSTLFLFGGFGEVTHTKLVRDKGYFSKSINTEVLDSLSISPWLCSTYRLGVSSKIPSILWMNFHPHHLDETCISFGCTLCCLFSNVLTHIEGFP